MVAGRSVIAVVSASLLVYGGFQWNLVERTNRALDNSSGHGAYLHPTDPHISPPGAVTASGTTPGRSAPAAAVPAAVPAAVHYQPENILLLGSDTRAGANSNAGNDNGQQSTAQSDTVMVAHISADRQHVTILSISRDLKINAPTCKEVNQTTGALTDLTYPVTPGTKWHFTNAFSVGGPACTDMAVQELTGLQITRILGIDFQGFKTMVDALHGVTVNVCRPIRDKTLGLVVAAGGVQRIGGDQALSLVRAREVAGDPSGDIGRIHRQQIVLSAMLRQVTTAGVLLNPAKLSSFLDAFVKATAFNDNITVDALVQLSHEFGDLAPGKVTFYTLPTHTDGDFQVVDSTGPAIFAALRNDQLLPGQRTVSPSSTTASTGPQPVDSSGTRTTTGTIPTTSTVPAASTAATTAPTTTAPTTTAPQTISMDPAGIDLQIDNLTGTAGVSSKVADTLNGYGFRAAADLVRPNNTQAGITVQYSAGNRDAATVVAAAVPGSTLTLESGLGQKIKLMLGTSYHGSLAKVAVGQPLPSRLQTTVRSTASSTTRSQSGSPAASPSSSTASSTTQKTAPGLKSSDIASVNA
ncbi:MAG: LCP family protein, partial [Actinomycetota bacterium]|nr:LCP family protein [Actinomycetota bacterium]